jgi:dihydroxyacetone kinase-like protein
VFCHDLLDELAARDIEPAFMKVGNYMTSIDMAGISLTLLDMTTTNWLDYLQYPVKTIAWS